VEDFAEPLPVRVLGDLLGFTTEECEQFRRWDDDHVALFGNRAGQPEIVERAQRSLNEQIAWLERVADRRRREPRDDLFGTLLDGLDSGALRDLPELLGSYLAILIGGHETTTGLISSAVMLLDRHPKQLGRLRADLSILPQAIEESLRYESPLQIVSRVAATDASIGSTAIKKGDLVLTIVGAANHDGEVFEDPGRFDVTRRPNRHLAFGAGVHFCIGAQLARLEARLALTTLLQRVPRFRVVADRIEWRDNDFFRVLKTLPIEFEAST